MKNMNKFSIFAFVVSIVCLISMVGAIGCSKKAVETPQIDPAPAVTNDATPVPPIAPEAAVAPAMDIMSEMSLDATPTITPVVVPVAPVVAPVDMK